MNRGQVKTYQFIETEQTLSEKNNTVIKHPIRVFSLDGLGVDKKTLIDLLSRNVPDLKWDFYDMRKAQLLFLENHFPDEKTYLKKIGNDYYLGNDGQEKIQYLIDALPLALFNEFKKIAPHRRRSICQFILHKEENKWQVQRIFEEGFSQDVDDYRLEDRVFHQTNKVTTTHPVFISLLQALARLTNEFRPKAKKLKLVAHEMATVTTRDTPGDNSPEGIHQDGSEFIVSALVIERKEVKDGRSHIYAPDKKTKYFDYILQPGEGIFQADKGTDLWHRVTSIYLDPNSTIERGERNILGFDIDVIEYF